MTAMTATDEVSQSRQGKNYKTKTKFYRAHVVQSIHILSAKQLYWNIAQFNLILGVPYFHPEHRHLIFLSKE